MKLHKTETDVIATPKSNYGDRLEVLAEENWSSLVRGSGLDNGKVDYCGCDHSKRLKVSRLRDHF